MMLTFDTVDVSCEDGDWCSEVGTVSHHFDKELGYTVLVPPPHDGRWAVPTNEVPPPNVTVCIELYCEFHVLCFLIGMTRLMG